MTTIRESGFVLKVATGAAIGVTDQSVLDPANMSSGSATLGQVPSADGAGGITWSDEIGPVPSGRQILNGTGITGGGDLTADRTLSVVQSALDPANQSSGSASAGQLPTASGGGAIAWADPPASVNLPGSSTNNALTRWSGTGGDTVKDSNVTLSDAGAMVFPSAGSISKPGTGANSETFGAGASSAGISSVVLGQNATVSTPTSGDSTGSIAIGQGSQVGQGAAAGVDASIGIGWNVRVNTGSSNSIAIGADATVGGGIRAIGLGYNSDALANFAIALGQSSLSQQDSALALGPSAKVYNVSSGDSTGAIAIGASAAVGNATPGAGCDAAIAIGEGATVGAGATNAVCIGPAASASDGSVDCTILGYQASVTAGADRCTVLGKSATAAINECTVVGESASATQNNSTVVGQGSTSTGIASTVVGADAGSARSNGVVLGKSARVWDVSSGDNAGAIAIGFAARVGNSTPGAGADAAIAIGQAAVVNVGHTNAVAIGVSAASTAANRVTFASTLEVEVGQGLAVWGVTPPGSQPAKINDITATAGASYTATEQGMLNDLKARVNSIIDVLEGAGLSSAT